MNFANTQTVAKPAAKLPDAPPVEGCPKCGKTLVDPAGLGWCSACGYCKSLAADDTKKFVEEEKRVPHLGSLGAAGSAIIGLPFWFWGCFLFAAAGVLFGIVMDRRLLSGESLERATWGTLMIAAGVFTIFLSQVFALVHIAPSEPTLSFKDALVPFRLWGLLFKRLPACKECLWSALLGGSLIIGGAVFVGGLSHWMLYLPKSQLERERDRANQTGGGTAITLPE